MATFKPKVCLALPLAPHLEVEIESTCDVTRVSPGASRADLLAAIAGVEGVLLPNSVHVVVPGAHGVGGAAIDRLTREFLNEASVADLDLSVVEGLRLPPLKLKAP